MTVGTRVVLALLATAASAASGQDTFGFYTPANDVEEHSRIDLDVKDISNYTGLGLWDQAQDVYENGRNSAKSDSLRALAAFSTELRAKADEIQTDKVDGRILPEFDLFATYYGADDYAHRFVTDALEDTGPVAGLGNAVRDQLAKKGVQYQVVLMYVLYELAKSLSLCFEGQDGAVNWDEGAAFYVGSLIDAAGQGSGELLYTLAEKRCASFGTCNGNGATEPTADANREALAAFRAGLAAIQARECSKASEQYQIIRKQIQIPLIQGMLLYAYLSDPTKGNGGDIKAMAEGWAFTAAVLPFLNEKSAALAQKIRQDMELRTGFTQLVPSGSAAVFTNTYEILPALCISCEEIGANDFALGEVPACTTDKSKLEDGCAEYLQPVTDSANVGLVVGLCVGGVVVILLILACMYKISKSESAPIKQASTGDAEGSSAAPQTAESGLNKV